MVDKVNDYINYYKSMKAQEQYFAQIDLYCRLYNVTHLNQLFQIDQSNLSGRSNMIKKIKYGHSKINSDHSIKTKQNKSTPISPTPNSLVSETPRGKKCTAEEEK